MVNKTQKQIQYIYNKQYIMKEESKIKPREALKLEITYDSREELLLEASNNQELRAMIIKDTLTLIEASIEKNTDSIHLCDVTNFKLKVEIERTQFKKCLQFMLKPYEKAEDWDTCIKIKALIDKL